MRPTNPSDRHLGARPRDFHHDRRKGWVRAARLYSNVVSPPTMFASLGLALGLHALPFWPGLAWAAVYGFFVSLTPILVVLFLLRSGRIRELHMSQTRERHIPYLAAVLSALIMLLISVAWPVPELLRCLPLINVIVLATLGLVNLRWLISIHATAAVATMLIVGLVFGLAAAAALAPVVISVVVVRLYLRRHTPAQLAAGLALGAFAVWALAQFGCFVS